MLLPRTAGVLLLSASTLLGVVACQEASADGPDGLGGQGGEMGQGGEPGAASGPLYVLATQSVSDTTSSVAFSFHRSMGDIEPSTFTEDARTFDNVAGFEVIDGTLYVSSGDAPEITAYEITDDLDWIEGETISFASYGFTDHASWRLHYILGPNRVMLPFGTFSRVIWNPAEMRIERELDDVSLPLEVDGYGYYNDGGNHTGARFEVGPAVQPFYTFGGADYVYGPDSTIVVYADDLEEQAAISVPCPDLETTSRAEDGSTYVSNTWHSGLYALFGGGLEPCVVRLTPEGELDEEFTTDFRAQTGGRFTQNFTYLRGGKAIARVLDHEALAEDLELDFAEGSYDVSLEYALFEGGYMDAWLFDLDRDTAAEITGIDVPLSQRPDALVLDDRTFLLVEAPDFTKTTVLEISDDAVATPRFEVPGGIVGWQRVR